MARRSPNVASSTRSPQRRLPDTHPGARPNACQGGLPNARPHAPPTLAPALAPEHAAPTAALQLHWRTRICPPARMRPPARRTNTRPPARGRAPQSLTIGGAGMDCRTD
eukprot:198633-Chlamydomonas_euryale.AAC.2